MGSHMIIEWRKPERSPSTGSFQRSPSFAALTCCPLQRLSQLQGITDKQRNIGSQSYRPVCFTSQLAPQSSANEMSGPSKADAGPAPTDDAATQPAPQRVIDENTDMSTLTDQEIMRLLEGMDHTEDVMSKVRDVKSETGSVMV